MKRVELRPPRPDKVRLVDMSQRHPCFLQKHHKAQSLDKPDIGEDVEDRFVFARQGIPLRQNSARGMWQSLFRKAGVAYRKFHDTRHAFASLLLSQGESPFYVKERRGHSSIQIKVDIDGHWIRSAQSQRAVDKLDRWGQEGFNIRLVK
ncbi:tyrosine-type recombinase/integrase [bacterium]|nr:tyrosine-type recombinase/integrase [bacterium]